MLHAAYSLQDKKSVINSFLRTPIQPIMLGKAKPPISGHGPQGEAQRAERGVEFWGGRGLPPPHQLKGLSSPNGFRGGGPAAERFSCILEAPDSLSWNLLGAKLGGRGPLGPLKSTYGFFVCLHLSFFVQDCV